MSTNGNPQKKHRQAPDERRDPDTLQRMRAGRKSNKKYFRAYRHRVA